MLELPHRELVSNSRVRRSEPSQVIRLRCQPRPGTPLQCERTKTVACHKMSCRSAKTMGHSVPFADRDRHNGREPSRPAMLYSTDPRALAGSAPAGC